MEVQDTTVPVVKLLLNNQLMHYNHPMFPLLDLNYAFFCIQKIFLIKNEKNYNKKTLTKYLNNLDQVLLRPLVFSQLILAPLKCDEFRPNVVGHRYGRCLLRRNLKNIALQLPIEINKHGLVLSGI